MSMDHRQFGRVASALKSYADGSRLALLHLLRGGTKNVGELTAAIGQTQPAVSHHLALLRAANVVTCERNGKENRYSLTPETAAALAFVDAVASAIGADLGAASAAVAAPAKGKPAKGKPKADKPKPAKADRPKRARAPKAKVAPEPSTAA
jgi:DNA-binding transcriptional ArsR family regulator